MKLNIKKLRVTITAAIAFALIAAGALYWNSKNAPMATASWWNDSWLYRQAILVTNNTNAETDVYISVTLDTNTASTSMQADCGDFRFTKEDGTVLPYYIVSGCRTATNVIHVSFDSFPAGAQAVYFYYGNATAENGFSEADFTTEASDYTLGAVQTVETGPGPVGYWSFDEGNGTIAHDESGQGNDGTITGAVWKNESECISGNCLYFTGSSTTYTSKPDAGSADPLRLGGGNATFAAWIRSSRTDIEQKIIDKRASWNGLYGYSFFLGSLNNLCLEYGNGSAYTQSCLSSSQSNLRANQWHYVAATLSGTTINYYINGELVRSATGNSGIAADTTTFAIGRSVGRNGQGFYGYIDEAKIYPYARTAEQIKQDYNAGLAGVSSNTGASAAFGSRSDSWLTDGLVGYWKFNESATTSGAVDSSGNGNDGIYYGDASSTAGKYGNALALDGSGDRVQAGDIDSIDGVAQMTLSAWFYRSLSTHVLTLEKGPDALNKLGINMNGGHTYFNLSNGQNSCWDYEYSGTGWVNLIMVFDGTKSANQEKLKIYKDGQEINNAALYQGLDIPSMTDDNSSQFLIGRSNVFSLDSSGRIDEVRLYNRALSPDEVRKLYEWAPEPVAYWKMDEMSGTKASDRSGNGIDFDLVGATKWKNGKYNSALSFDTSHASSSNAPSLPDSGTLEAWVKVDRWGNNYDTVIMKGSDISWQGIHYGILRNNANSQFVGSISDGTSVYGGSGPKSSAISLDKWYHLAFSWDSSVGGKFYTNGILSGAFNNTTIRSAASQTMYLGRGVNGSSYPFYGSIDDVRIYNYARTQKQILEDMHGGNPGLYPLAEYDFDEGYGTAIHDGSGNAKDLTLSSAGWTTIGRNGKAYAGADNRRAYDNADDNDLDFGATEDFSLTGWIKYGAGNPAATEYIIHKQAGNEGYAVYMDTDGDIIFGIGDTSSASFPEDTAGNTGTDLADGNWHHFAAVKTGNSKIDMYIDGELKHSDSSLAANSTLENAGTLYIGDANATDGTDEFLGDIDEIKIFNYALSIDEVKTEYNQGSSLAVNSQAGADNNGTAVTGAATEYCVPGDTAQCDKPVLELKFDEMSGTTTYDTSGNGNDGVFVNTSTSPSWKRGKNGAALDFDGIDDYVNVGHGSSLNITDAITMEVWVNSENSQLNQDIINKGYQTEYRGYEFALETNRMAFRINPTASSYEYRYSDSVNLTNNNWYHLAAVYNGINIYFYKNGISMNTVAAEGQLYPAAASDVYMGMYADGTTHPFTGKIDGARIYNYARTPSQIAWDYNRGQPIAEYRFDECQGVAVHDESENGKQAQIYLGATGIIAHGICASSSDSFWYNGRNGKHNSSGSFDGLSDYAMVNDNALFDLPGDFSVSVWVKIADQNARCFLGKTDPTNHGAALCYGYQEGGVSQGFMFLSNNYKNAPYEHQHDSDVGQWHHLVGIVASTTRHLYIDGRYIGSDYSGMSSWDNADNFYIGRASGTSSHAYGQIDDVKIWNYPLTAQQVKEEYNGGSIKFGE